MTNHWPEFWMLALLVLSLGDIYSTWRTVKRTGPEREANPFMRWLFERVHPLAAMGIGYAVVLALFWYFRDVPGVLVVIVLSTLLRGYVVLNNLKIAREVEGETE